MSNVTVLTPPPAINLRHTVSLHGPYNRTLSSDPDGVTEQSAAAKTCEQAPLLPVVCISPPADDKAIKTLHCDIASHDNNATKQPGNDDKEASDATVDNTATCRVVTLPAKQHSDDQLTGLTGADIKANLCLETRADEGLAACPAGDVDVNISDDSLHVDTQMLCGIAGRSVDDAGQMTNVLKQATAVAVSDSNKLMSDEVFNASAELDSFGLNSATCQFMKEFSTQKCTVQTSAAVASKVKDCEPSDECVVSVPVETAANPCDPQPDLLVSITSELVAASNFDRVCVAADNEVNRQIAYSEEMLFDDIDQCAPLQSCFTGNLPPADNPNCRLAAGMDNGITSDSAEKPAADDCAENKSDLFASYIEEPDIAVRADICSTELPAENSFGLAHDSLTCTMLDRAMAAVNQPAVGNQEEVVKCPLVSAADAKPQSDTNTKFVGDTNLRNLQTDVPRLYNTEPADIDAEAALRLLCESSHKPAEKPPKRRGRKRNSDSADPFTNPGTCNSEEKRRRSSKHSPQLFAEGERADVSLNEAVCGQTSFSVSFGSTSDSSAYIPPTPPSIATEKSNVNTPRRLLGGIAGVTPVKSDHSVHKVHEVKKNVSQFKGCMDKAPTEQATIGITEAAISESEVKTDATSPASTQGLNSSQSFTIIDVASNRLLFDTFVDEWRRQQKFSLSLACEKRSKPRTQLSRRSTEGIGCKFTRGNQTLYLLLCNQNSFAGCTG